MSSILNLARVAAVIAIFGFFLPWAEVSCSGAPLVHETGIQLITGGADSAAPGHHDVWVAAALVLIVVGLAGSLLLRGRSAALILLATALVAGIASLIGVAQEVPSAGAQAQIVAGSSSGDAAARQAAGELIRAQLEYGYFVTLGGLIATIAAAALALAGRGAPNSESG